MFTSDIRPTSDQERLQAIDLAAMGVGTREVQKALGESPDDGSDVAAAMTTGSADGGSRGVGSAFFGDVAPPRTIEEARQQLDTVGGGTAEAELASAFTRAAVKARSPLALPLKIEALERQVARRRDGVASVADLHGFQVGA